MVTDKNCCTSDTREIPLVHTAKNTRYICDRICDHAIVDTITLSRQIAQRPRDRDDRVTIDDVLSSSYFEIEMRRYVECTCVFQFRFFFRRSIEIFYNFTDRRLGNSPIDPPNRTQLTFIDPSLAVELLQTSLHLSCDSPRLCREASDRVTESVSATRPIRFSNLSPVCLQVPRKGATHRSYPVQYRACGESTSNLFASRSYRD